MSVWHCSVYFLRPYGVLPQENCVKNLRSKFPHYAVGTAGVKSPAAYCSFVTVEIRSVVTVILVCIPYNGKFLPFSGLIVLARNNKCGKWTRCLND